MAKDPVESGMFVFFSYSHEDKRLRDQLEKHLTTLRRKGWITTWHDRMISGGEDWAGQIDDHMNVAQIILLLVSADFIASKYCYDVEMKRAIERSRAGEARTIPVILRDCMWEDAPFSGLQCLPENRRAVASWGKFPHDRGFTEVAKGVRKVVDQLIQREEQRVKEAVQKMEEANALDAHHAATIIAQIAADAQKHRVERWKLLQDTQRKIFEIQQDVSVNKARVADKTFNAMEKYIKG